MHGYSSNHTINDNKVDGGSTQINFQVNFEKSDKPLSYLHFVFA